MNRHKTFISYHHSSIGSFFQKSDAEYRKEFEDICLSKFNIIISKSVQDGDIPSWSSPENTHRIIRDEYLRDSTVTVVLIGNDTWRRKHVDWEISSSLRHTSYNPRSGLIGIILPSFKNKFLKSFLSIGRIKIENSFFEVNKNDIPERLAMNIDNGFAKIYEWSNNPFEIEKWIHEAFDRRNKINPDNTLQMFQRNR